MKLRLFVALFSSICSIGSAEFNVDISLNSMEIDFYRDSFRADKDFPSFQKIINNTPLIEMWCSIEAESLTNVLSILETSRKHRYDCLNMRNELYNQSQSSEHFKKKINLLDIYVLPTHFESQDEYSVVYSALQTRLLMEHLTQDFLCFLFLFEPLNADDLWKGMLTNLVTFYRNTESSNYNQLFPLKCCFLDDVIHAVNHLPTPLLDYLLDEYTLWYYRYNNHDAITEKDRIEMHKVIEHIIYSALHLDVFVDARVGHSSITFPNEI